MPEITPNDNGFNLNVEVQNFGQVESQIADILVVYSKNKQEVEVAAGKVPKLESFQKTNIDLICGKLFEKDVEYDLRVIINPCDKQPVTLHGKIIPMW